MTANDDARGDYAAMEDRALRAALRTDVLSADALSRIRDATEAEWRANTERPAPRRWPAIAAAASVATVAVLGGWWFRPIDLPSERGVTLVRILKSTGSGVVAHCPLQDCGAVNVGSALPVGRAVRFDADVLTSLSNGGTLHIGRGAEIEAEASGGLRVHRGEIYVDISPDLPDRTLPFVVQTDEGRFQHFGTQFSVTAQASGTRLRVREGQVKWLAQDEVLVTKAGTELLIDEDRSVTRRAISTAGAEWALIESLPPDIDIENRLLADYLEWIARQMGRKLEYADPLARTIAGQTRLHGTVSGLSTRESLTTVMSSTSLQYEVSGRVIRVSSLRESIVPK